MERAGGELQRPPAGFCGRATLGCTLFELIEGTGRRPRALFFLGLEKEHGDLDKRGAAATYKTPRGAWRRRDISCFSLGAGRGNTEPPPPRRS
jgi:hypothetical protein